jgi:hypothetical protein
VDGIAFHFILLPVFFAATAGCQIRLGCLLTDRRGGKKIGGKKMKRRPFAWAVVVPYSVLAFLALHLFALHFFARLLQGD